MSDKGQRMHAHPEAGKSHPIGQPCGFRFCPDYAAAVEAAALRVELATAQKRADDFKSDFLAAEEELREERGIKGRLLQALRKLEWSQTSEYDTCTSFCPECRGQFRRHKAECSLAATIASAGGAA